MSIIEVHNVSVRYIIRESSGISLKEFLVKKLKGKLVVKEKWALRNVSFNVEKGELLGIIGSNGSGKSTFLKVVAGIMVPTEGYVRTQAAVFPLMGLGAGFDNDLTVKENIYLKSALLGFSERDVKVQYGDIIDFSELKDYEEAPFRTLSSGMKSKLAFSLASIMDPEILILDEVLGVGDIAFRRKSEEKMKSLIHNGVTTLFVSHSLAQIKGLCTRVLWIEQGKMMGIGDTNEICDRYEQYMKNK